MRSISFFVAVAFATFALAQSPQSFNYQGVARDAMGEPMSSQAIGVEFQLRSGAALGPVVYSETHGATTDMFGLFTLHVGEGTAGTGTFSAVDWSHGPYFLEVGLDLSASGIYTSFGTQQLLSVPYALHAGSSGDLPDGTEVGQIMHWDGGAWVADSGLYVYQKRFGIGGETAPSAPLGIKGEPGQDDQMISFHSTDASQKWNINLNPTGNDVDGFSIDDATSGIGSSRLFIEQTSGNVGVGNTEPQAPLSIKERNQLYEEFKNGDIPNENDFVISTGGNTGLSFDQDTSGGYASRLAINSSTGHVGIGTNDPPAALAIESRDILKTYFQTGNVPTEQDFAIRTDSTGFDIGQGTPNALASRLFIDHVSQGNIGIGNVDPKAKLHVSGANDGANVSIMVENLESSSDGGWLMSAVDDSAVPERMKTFAIHEKTGVELSERITVLSGGNVGINEVLPYAKLHVSRPTSDPSSAVALAENTGILCLGQIEDNLAADYRGVQARHGEYVGGGPTLSFTASDLNLQRLGGDILIHGDDAVDHQVSITGDGRVGIGKAATEKLEINGAIVVGTTDNVAPSNGTIRWNTATEDLEGFVGTAWTSLTSGGWQKVDNTDNIYYDAGATPRVGIGTSTPDVTLHVSRPLADPIAAMSLTEGSGIMVLGPMTDNIVMDHQGIQARQVLAGATSMVGSGLHLQRLGGDILIHGDDALESNRVIVTGGGRIGIGTLTPGESIHTAGAIKIGTNTNEEDGTIRWTGTDFEGRKGGSWNSLTTHTNTDGLWQVGATGGIEYSPPGGGAKVSVLPLPSTPVRVDSWAAVVERSIGAQFQNTSTTSSANPADNRVGLQILNDGTWGGSPASKDIGLYVSDVSGQAAASSNIAAVLNGNVVVGDVTSGQMVGTDGSRVLAIQNGTAPAVPVSGALGTPDGGVQLYSTSDLTGVSSFHVMNGDGTVIQLRRAPDLTAADPSSVDGTYDASEAALLENMRTRINDLENVLKALGLLTP